MSLLNAIVTWSGGDASTPSRRSPPTSPFDMREAGPVVVGVSGGRTSAVLLDRVIEASGGLPDDVHPVFTDTGEELPETYQFLERLEAHYGIELVRLRRPPGQPAEAYADYAEGMGLALEDLTPLDHLVVDYEVGTRRRGVPFALFGGPARWCTTELKMREAERWAVTAGIQDHVHLLGIRADEPARVRRTDGKREARPVYPAGGEPWLVGDAAVPIGRVAYETVAPLAEAGVTAADVLAFWRRMPFDLEMPSRLGNCGGCPLKNRAGLLLVEMLRPGTLEKWARREEFYQRRLAPPLPLFAGTPGPADHGRWRHKRSIREPYRQLVQIAERQRRSVGTDALDALAAQADDAAFVQMTGGDAQQVPCFCGDGL